MEPRLPSRSTDGCLSFCGNCRHLKLSLHGPHACALGHDLSDSADYLRCRDRSPFPETGGSEKDLSE